MTNIAETKARLLGNRIKKAIEQHDLMNPLDLTPIIDHLINTLSYVEGALANMGKIETVPGVRQMKELTRLLEWKERLVEVIDRVDIFQNPRHPGPPMDIHILSIYLFPDLYEYGSRYEPTTDCGVSAVYNAIGKVLCNWSGHTYYGD